MLVPQLHAIEPYRGGGVKSFTNRNDSKPYAQIRTGYLILLGIAFAIIGPAQCRTTPNPWAAVLRRSQHATLFDASTFLKLQKHE